MQLSSLSSTHAHTHSGASCMLYVSWFWYVACILSMCVLWQLNVNNGSMCDTGRMLLLYSDGCHVEGVVLCQLLLYNYIIIIFLLYNDVFDQVYPYVVLYRDGQSWSVSYSYIFLLAKYIYKIKIQIVQFVPMYLQLKDCSSKLSVPMYIVILIYMLDYIYT